MKTLKKSSSVVKINRRIDIEEIKDTDFAYYFDIKEINTDGTVENIITNGVTSIENLISVNKMEKISEKISVSKMYEGIAYVVAIKKDDFKQVLNDEKHITEVVKEVNKVNLPISDEYMLVLWNNGSFKIMDLNYNFISIPISFNYIYGLSRRNVTIK